MLYRVLMAIDDGPTRVRIRHALHGRSAVVRAIGALKFALKQQKVA